MKHILKESEVKAYTQPMYDALIRFKKPAYARKEIGISKAHWDEVIVRTKMPEDIGEVHASLNQIATNLQTEINLLTERAVPDGIVEKIEKCYECVRKDDAIGGIIDVHTNFGFEGFHTKVTEKKSNEKLSEFNTKFDMDSIVLRMWESASRCDHIFLTWGGKGKSVQYVSLLDPRIHLAKPLDVVDTKTGKPKFDVYRKVVQGASEIDRLTGTKAKMGRPKKGAYDKIKSSENVLLRTLNGGTDRMVEPSMVRIFPDYELRRLIRDGDFTIFFHIKHMIHQIQVGAKETETGQAFWQKNQVPTADQLNEILNKYKNSDKTMIEVTNAMQTHNFIAPDPKFFDGAKYSPVVQRIRDWGNVQGLFGDGTKYSSGYLQMKSLKAKLRRWRRIMTRMLQEFYRLALDIEHVSIMWDEHNMLEPAQVLERMNGASERGLSNQTYLEQLDFHPEAELLLKEEENKNPEKYFPPFEAKQGITLAWLKKQGLVLVEAPKEDPGEGDPGAKKDIDKIEEAPRIEPE